MQIRYLGRRSECDERDCVSNPNSIQSTVDIGRHVATIDARNREPHEVRKEDEQRERG